SVTFSSFPSSFLSLSLFLFLPLVLPSLISFPSLRSVVRLPLYPTLFPYTTLFRSFSLYFDSHDFELFELFYLNSRLFYETFQLYFHERMLFDWIVLKHALF